MLQKDAIIPTGKGRYFMIVNENLSLRLWTILAILVGWHMHTPKSASTFMMCKQKGRTPGVAFKAVRDRRSKEAECESENCFGRARKHPDEWGDKTYCLSFTQGTGCRKTSVYREAVCRCCGYLEKWLARLSEAPGDLDSLDDYAEVLAYLGAVYLKLQYGGDAKDTPFGD